MKQRKNMFKAFTAALLLSANLAYAANATPEEVQKNNSVWGQFLAAVRDAKLSQKIDIPAIELYRGIEIGGEYNFESNPSVNGNYSGIDIWEIKAGVDSRIFGYELPVNISAGASKKITYIQQFKDRKDSLLRVPYDPITKIPRTSQDFFKRDSNNQLVFKTGDFIGYRIPLVFQANTSTVKNLVGSALPVTVGYRYFLSGEFDIQIFRMSENLIRLKIIAVNDKAHGWFGGIKLFVQDPTTSLIVEKLLDDRIFSGSTTDRKSDLYLGDYVLNIDSPDARDLYDSIVAEKMKILNIDLLKEYLSATQFLKDRRQFNKNLFADLSQFNEVAAEDKNLAVEKRRVIKVINAENHTESEDSSATFNLIRLLKYTRNANSAKAEIAVVGDTVNSKENYFLHAAGKNSKWSFFDNWKKEKRTQLNILFKADATGIKTGLVGIHFAKSRKHFGLSADKYLSFFEATGQHMPSIIRDKIKFPHEGKRLLESYDNIYMNYDLYVTNRIFELNQNLSSEVIDQRLTTLLGKIKALKYKDTTEDKNKIVAGLTTVFSNDSTLDEKFKIFDGLTIENELFSEFGLVIMMNVINPESVVDCVLAQLSYSGHDIGSSVMKFPSDEGFNRINLFKNIIEQNNYILDRSYNLRNFLKEDGAPYSVHELILKNGTIGL